MSMSSTSRAALRRELINLVESDEEFRAKLSGLILPKELGAIASELVEIRKDIRAQFEAINRRFEDVNRRFEEINQRFTEVNQRFEAIDKRFEAVERRFEAVERRFEAIDKRFEALIEQLRSMRIELSALGNRLGRGAEELVRQTIRSFSGAEVREVSRLELRDESGEVYGRPASVEFDAFAADGEKYLLEVKSYARMEDVLLFARKAEWAEKNKLGKTVRILVSASVDSDAFHECARLGIKCVTRNVVPPDTEELEKNALRSGAADPLSPLK